MVLIEWLNPCRSEERAAMTSPMAPHTSISLRNIRAFGPEASGFDAVGQVNVLVGRNNAGKSSLLDAIAFLIDPRSTDLAALGHGQAHPPEIVITTLLTEESLRRRFAESTSGGPIRGNHWAYGKHWINGTITWS